MKQAMEMSMAQGNKTCFSKPFNKKRTKNTNYVGSFVISLWFKITNNPHVNTRPLAHPFVRTAHSFTYSCIHLLTHSPLNSWDNK